MAAMQLGTPKFLSPGEVEKTTEMNRMTLVTDRAWEFFARRAR
jgi:hypothetical protein